MVRPPRLSARFLVGMAVVALLLGAGFPMASGAAPSSGVALSIGSDGTLNTNLETVAANGSALRYAMDGYFGPLVASLPVSNSTKASLLATINATESNPLLAGLFGNHDGKVDSPEVALFGNLILNEAKLIPLTAVTGVFNVTMDGKGPSSDRLQGISFSGAEGADASTTPIGVTATLVATFAWSGTGASHTFEIAWNLPSILGNLTVGAPLVNLSFSTPDAITITSVDGLNGTQISNDPFGWGAAHASGQYTPLPGHSVVVRFGPAFPTGDALIIGAIVVAAGAGVAFLLLRRRRRRRSTAPSSPGPSSRTETEVGPSSGSG